MVAIATIITMLFFGILGATFGHLTATRVSSAVEDLQSSQAFYVAEGAVQYVAMSQFVGDSDFADNASPTGAPFGGTPISLGAGQFWVEYLNQGGSAADLQITARVGDSVRVLQQRLAQGGSGFQYVTMAGGNLNMNSSSGDIYGDVGLHGNINPSPDVVIHNNITQDPTLVLPTLDFDIYEAMCDSTQSGNITISADDTGNLCVTGNVTIDGNVTYTGLLYAGGNVTINGNDVVVNGTIISEGNFTANHRTGLQFTGQSPEPGVHMPAVASGGNISIANSDGMQVTGVMWTSGNIDLGNSDNLVYTGSFIGEGNVLMNSASNIMLTFDADLLVGVPGLSGGGTDQTGSLSFSGWKTFAPWW